MRIASRTFLLLALAGLAPAGAVVITVGTLVDADVSEGLCSLREAIVAANDDTAHRECPAGSGADRIEFAVTGIIVLAADLPAITESLELAGPAIAGSEFALTIDGADQFRPILASGSSGFELKANRVAFLNGHALDPGGCLSASGGDLLELRRVRFEGCSSDDEATSTGSWISIPSDGASVASSCASFQT